MGEMASMQTQPRVSKYSCRGLWPGVPVMEGSGRHIRMAAIRHHPSQARKPHFGKFRERFLELQNEQMEKLKIQY